MNRIDLAKKYEEGKFSVTRAGKFKSRVSGNQYVNMFSNTLEYRRKEDGTYEPVRVEKFAPESGYCSNDHYYRKVKSGYSEYLFSNKIKIF